MNFRSSSKPLVAAAAISVIGLSLGSVGVMYIAGMFGLSSAFASQIVDAVTVGGWVLAVVMGLLSGGTAAVIVATTRWAILRFGRAVAIAQSAIHLMMGSAKEIASQSWPYALALSLALLAAGAAIGAQADVGLALDAPSPDPQGTEWTEAFVKVLLNNASTGALLYAGAATVGTATLIVWPVVAAYIGATFRASAGAVGVENVVGTIWPYAPLEFVGMCLAAAAGLMPLVSGLRAAFEPQSVGPARAYAREIPSTLKVFLASLTLIALAAAVEAAVIAF